MVLQAALRVGHAAPRRRRTRMRPGACERGGVRKGVAPRRGSPGRSRRAVWWMPRMLRRHTHKHGDAPSRRGLPGSSPNQARRAALRATRDAARVPRTRWRPKTARLVAGNLRVGRAAPRVHRELTRAHPRWPPEPVPPSRQLSASGTPRRAPSAPGEAPVTAASTVASRDGAASSWRNSESIAPRRVAGAPGRGPAHPPTRWRYPRMRSSWRVSVPGAPRHTAGALAVLPGAPLRARWRSWLAWSLRQLSELRAPAQCGRPRGRPARWPRPSTRGRVVACGAARFPAPAAEPEFQGRSSFHTGAADPK